MKNWNDIYFEAFTNVLGEDGYKPSTSENEEISKETYNLAIKHAFELMWELADKLKDFESAAQIIKLKQ